MVLALDCTDDLRSLIDLPVGLSLQVLFEPGEILKDEGLEGISRRLAILAHLVDAGLSVRVLTSYDPSCPLLLTELGEKLDRVGIKRWLICPGDLVEGESRLTEAALEEVRALSRDIPWLSVQYGGCLEREFDLLIYSNGAVVARDARPGSKIRGNVDQLAAGTLLPRAFLDPPAEPRRVDLCWTFRPR